MLAVVGSVLRGRRIFAPFLFSVAATPALAAPAGGAAPEEASKAAAPEAPFRRFEIASDDAAHRLELRALLHADARFSLDRAEGNAFFVRRARPSLEGALFRHYEFKVQSDFAGGRLSLLDAFVNLHFVDELQFRAGKGKVPLGLERLRTPSALTFAERAFPTSLVPNRDVGLLLHGEAFDRAVNWELGVFNGVPNGQSGDGDENASKDLVARVFAKPFGPSAIALLRGLGVGVGVSHGGQAGDLPAYRNPAGREYFSYLPGTAASGRRTAFVPQAHYFFGPLGVVYEYARVSERVANAAGAGTVTHEAYQVAVSSVIGGDAGYEGVELVAPLDPERGTWGALELGGRYSGIAFDHDAFAFGLTESSRSAWNAEALTLGVTWHFARRVRALVNYERTSYDGGAERGDRESEALVIGRAELGF